MRAAQLGHLWRRERVSKYNGAAESTPPNRPYVVVVDQTVGDRCSVRSLERDGRHLATFRIERTFHLGDGDNVSSLRVDVL